MLANFLESKKALLTIVPANTPRMDEVSLDPLVLAFTFGVCLLTGLFFGLAPGVWHPLRGPIYGKS